MFIGPLAIYHLLLPSKWNNVLIYSIALNPVTLTDIALIRNNAKVGSQIAVALSKHLNEAKSGIKTDGKQTADSGSDVVSVDTRMCEMWSADQPTPHGTHNAFSSAGGRRRNKRGFHCKGKRKNPAGESFFRSWRPPTLVEQRVKLLTALSSPQFGQTNPGSVCQSFGGVGRNIAGMLRNKV